MQDVVGYILGLGMVVLPAYLMIEFSVRIMQAVFVGQNIILAFPFP